MSGTCAFFSVCKLPTLEVIVNMSSLSPKTHHSHLTQSLSTMPKPFVSARRGCCELRMEVDGSSSQNTAQTSLPDRRRDSLVEERNDVNAVEGVDKAAQPQPTKASSSSVRIISTCKRGVLPVVRHPCACIDCRPDLYLQTVHAHELQKFQRTSSTLGLFQHDCVQLAELAIASFDGKANNGMLSFAQHHAVQRWKHWLRDLESQAWPTALDLSEYHPHAILQAPIEIFNQLFFLGQLPVFPGDNDCGRLVVQWSPPGTTRRAQSHTIWNGDDRPPNSIIWINAEHRTHFLNPKELVKTLLHELCHTILQRYSCYNGGGVGCERNQVCVELCQENYGVTGHGRVWQMLAAAIEEAAPRLLLGWRVDLGREEGAVREVERMGAGWWPTKCDVPLFSHDFASSLKMLIRSRDDNVMVIEMTRSWVLKGWACPVSGRPRVRKPRSM